MNKLQRVLCYIFIFIAIVISGSKVFAKDGNLNDVIISDKQDAGYEITLKTDKATSYTQNAVSNDKIIIKLKGLTPSEKTNTLYQKATNIKHIIIKPVFNGTIIEINGKNAAMSKVNITGGVNTTHSPSLIGIFCTIILIIGLFAIQKRKQNHFSTKISNEDLENKILKVAFENNDGIFAGKTLTKKMPYRYSNVRKVKFMEDLNSKELNIK